MFENNIIINISYFKIVSLYKKYLINYIYRCFIIT